MTCHAIQSKSSLQEKLMTNVLPGGKGKILAFHSIKRNKQTKPWHVNNKEDVKTSDLSETPFYPKSVIHTYTINNTNISSSDKLACYYTDRKVIGQHWMKMAMGTNSSNKKE